MAKEFSLKPFYQAGKTAPGPAADGFSAILRRGRVGEGIGMAIVFQNRQEAGKQLAARLQDYRGGENLLVLALPRGGVPVGYEIARELGCPLDVLIVRKIGCPGNPELAAGAVSETGTRVLNADVIAMQRISPEYLDGETERQRREIVRRLAVYRDGETIGSLAAKTVLLVDDGVATGATMKAAVATLRREGLTKLVVAVPVAPPSTAREIAPTVDAWVCLDTPAGFAAVGQFFRDFTQVEDAEVVALLKKARKIEP
jgi:predicted phosphoribosyltransferase